MISCHAANNSYLSEIPCLESREYGKWSIQIRNENVNFFQEMCYMTFSSSIKNINDAFQNILWENGVDNVYFLGESNPKQIEEILSHDGSLRCMSTPGSVIFGHLGSLYGSHVMLNKTSDIEDKSCSIDSSDQEDNFSDEYCMDVIENNSVLDGDDDSDNDISCEEPFHFYHNNFTIFSSTSSTCSNKNHYATDKFHP